MPHKIKVMTFNTYLLHIPFLVLAHPLKMLALMR